MQISLGDNQQTIFEHLYENYDLNDASDFALGKKEF